MKKFILVLIVLTVFATLVHAELLTRGELRTRMALYYDIGEDMPTKSYTDTRFQMIFENAISEQLSAVWKVQVGDYIWGSDFPVYGNNGIDIKTQNLYLAFLCPVTGMNAKIGIQEWSDPRSLVLNDTFAPFAGIMLNKEFGDGIMVEVGTAKLDKHNIAKDKDWDLFFLNFEMDMFGINNIIGRWNTGKSIDAWIMPFLNYEMNDLYLHLLAAYNYGSYEEGAIVDGEMEDVTNGGFAVSLNAKYNLEPVHLGLDFLFASGDDGEDPTSTSYFNSIIPFYENGLEIFGKGVHSGASVGDVPPGNNGDGLMSIVLTGAYPMSEKMTLKGAFGLLNALEGDDTDMGIEFDLGMSYMLYENLSFDLVGAMAMPGKYYGEDLDNTMALVSKFMYRF
jgi:hypothetical protein